MKAVNPDGAPVFQNKNFKARNSKINLCDLAQRLLIGEYIIKLPAPNSNIETESVADYSFRIIREQHENEHEILLFCFAVVLIFRG
ncbi:hypothetical protein BH20ACI4_BH20ACI4_25490 [soil metagenome]